MSGHSNSLNCCTMSGQDESLPLIVSTEEVVVRSGTFADRIMDIIPAVKDAVREVEMTPALREDAVTTASLTQFVIRLVPEVFEQSLPFALAEYWVLILDKCAQLKEESRPELPAAPTPDVSEDTFEHILAKCGQLIKEKWLAVASLATA